MPGGWKAATKPDGLRIECSQFRYIAEFSVEGENLVLDQKFELRERTTPRGHTPQLDGDVRRMLEFERKPLIITRGAGTGG